MVEGSAVRYGDQLAIRDGATELTYNELLDQARRFAAALVASGVEPGDRVALWAFNSVEWVVAFIGLLQAGAVLVPINTRFKGFEAADILRRGGVKALVTVTDFLGTDYVAMLESTEGSLPALETIVIARGPASGSGIAWDAFLARADDGALEEVGRREAALRGESPSDILFTSGTTGVPKGVVMTHSRSLPVGLDWSLMTGLRAGDRYLMVNPYFHMFGLKGGIIAALSAGATLLPVAVFDVDEVFARVEHEQVTVLPGAPTLYQSILDHPDRARYDLSSLRVAVTGAADIPVELIRRIHDELPFSIIITGYGLTEAGTSSATGEGDDFETIATTVGRPRPGFEIRIVDEDRVDVPLGTAGEILLRGPSVMARYLDDPEETAKVLSDDGWLATGDHGVVDEAGCLRIVGRVKDMFIVGGFNAYPAEIENALLRHPGVQQAAVIGIPDHRMGEVGMAFVVRDDPALSAEELLAWSREQMANYKVPRQVAFLEALPLNATGKVMKNDLRALVAHDSEAP
jgi:acyl-CoA synthetase (AMP-forming)/AMP-acid ligase II